MATVSLNQYEPPTKSRATTNPMMRPPWPKKAPIPMISAPIAASRTAVFTLFFMTFSLVRLDGASEKNGSPCHAKVASGRYRSQPSPFPEVGDLGDCGHDD